MDLWQLTIFAIVGFLTAIFSGVAGGGGGFIMTPLMIFLGLTPAQSVVTGKAHGLFISAGSLLGIKKAKGKSVSLKRVLPFVILSFVLGLGIPFLITSIDSSAYQLIIGIIMLLMIPVVILKKMGVQTKAPSNARKTVGGVLIAILLTLQGTFSGGVGSLSGIVLMDMWGMSALEANITRRWSQLTLNIAILLGVIGTNFLVWDAAIVGAIAVFAGGMIGGQISVKKGNVFIVRTLVVLMFISGVALIVSA